MIFVYYQSMLVLTSVEFIDIKQKVLETVVSTIVIIPSPYPTIANILTNTYPQGKDVVDTTLREDPNGRCLKAKAPVATIDKLEASLEGTEWSTNRPSTITETRLLLTLTGFMAQNLQNRFVKP